MSVNITTIPSEKDGAERDVKRHRSSIRFPYCDYQKCSGLVVAIYDNVGRSECSQEQLAAWTGQSVNSSGFRSQITAAKLFGLIEDGNGDGTLRLTNLGWQTTDLTEARGAKAKAFLNVPLFAALYESHKQGTTPSNPAAIEQEIEDLGVSPRQKAKARMAFENSAQQTGFRDVAPNKLVMPASVVHEERPVNGDEPGGGEGGDGTDKLDPLIEALIAKIPSGNEWSGVNRLRWFRTLAMVVSQVFDKGEELVELEIKLVNVDSNGDGQE